MEFKKLSMLFGKLVLVGSVLAFIAGCYYRVTDPTTGKQYYTTEIKELKSGSIKLKDAATNKKVTITNSEIEEISEQEFKAGTCKD